MEQKIKFILFGLIGISAVCFFLFLQALNSKQLIVKERNSLKQENTTLNGKFEELRNSLQDYENKIGSLNRELNRISQERQEIEKKYRLAIKEREELVERLQSQRSHQAVVPRAEAVVQTTDAYWAQILKAKTDLELQLSKLSSEFKTIQINNEQLQREKSDLILEVNNLQREKEDLIRQIDYNKKLMDSIAQDLVREKNDKTKIKETYKSLNSENSLLRRQLKSLNNRKINLEKKLQELEEKNITLEHRLTEMETMLTEKVSQVDDLKEKISGVQDSLKTGVSSDKEESVELPPIIVRPPSEFPARDSIKTRGGSVLALNRENNFVIIDLGEDAGIRPGEVFRVYREGKLIATLEVIQTRRNISACDIKEEATPIKIGDKVR